MKEQRPLNVLFLCAAAILPSIMAEAIVNRVGTGKFKGYSAGSMPTGKVHPMALELLNRLNYDTSNARSKSWEEFSAPVRRNSISSSPFATTPRTKFARSGRATNERALGLARSSRSGRRRNPTRPRLRRYLPYAQQPD